METLIESIQNSRCLECGNIQYTNHLGDENCNVCDSKNWLDIASWKRAVLVN